MLFFFNIRPGFASTTGMNHSRSQISLSPALLFRSSQADPRLIVACLQAHDATIMRPSRWQHAVYCRKRAGKRPRSEVPPHETAWALCSGSASCKLLAFVSACKACRRDCRLGTWTRRNWALAHKQQGQQRLLPLGDHGNSSTMTSSSAEILFNVTTVELLMH